MAADAVLVEKAHDDGFFLLRASHPVPRGAGLFGQQVSLDALRFLGPSVAPAPAPKWPSDQLIRVRLENHQGGPEEETACPGTEYKPFGTVNGFHGSSPADPW
jgi:hypothetical protein